MSISRNLALTGLPALAVLGFALAASLHSASAQTAESSSAPAPAFSLPPASSAAVSPAPPPSPLDAEPVALTRPLAPAMVPVAAPVAAPVVVPAPTPSGFTFNTEADRGAVHQGGDGLVRVQVIIGSEHETGTLTQVPTDLVVVMDTSGSMAGRKLRDAKAAAEELVSQLGPEDRFSLVSFDSGARVRVSMNPATRENRLLWKRAIRSLEDGGSTQMAAGLQTGASQHGRSGGRVGRTVLISDGLPDSQAGLHTLASQAARSETPLTTVGIGDDYDEQLMASLADAGTGNFYWVHGNQDLARVFADELSTSRESVASGLAVRAHLGEGVQLVDAAGYPVGVEDGLPTFRVGSLFAGQQRSFWVTLRLPVGQSVDSIDPGAFELVVSETDGRTARLGSDLRPVRVEASRAVAVAAIDKTQWEQAVVEEDYNRMRQAVAARVQAGDQSGALSLVGSYIDGNYALNEDVGSAVVADNLDEARGLQQQLQTTSGRDNDLAKELNAASYSKRRGGQAKGY